MSFSLTIVFWLLGIYSVISIAWAIAHLGDKYRKEAWWEAIIYAPAMLFAVVIGCFSAVAAAPSSVLGYGKYRVRRVGCLVAKWFRPRPVAYYERRCATLGQLREVLQALPDDALLEDSCAMPTIDCVVTHYSDGQAPKVRVSFRPFVDL